MCIYTHLHTHTNQPTPTHTHTQRHTHTRHTHTQHTHTPAHIQYVPMCTFVFARASVHTCLHRCMHLHTRACRCVNVDTKPQRNWNRWAHKPCLSPKPSTVMFSLAFARLTLNQVVAEALTRTFQKAGGSAGVGVQDVSMG